MGKGSGFKPNFRNRKPRKTGLTTVELQKIFPELNEPIPDETSNTKTYTKYLLALIIHKQIINSFYFLEKFIIDNTVFSH
jgi:hypothetical protein